MAFFRKYRWSILWCIVVFVLSVARFDSMTTPPKFLLFPHSDKLIHFVLYFVMCVLICAENRRNAFWNYFAAVIFAVFYGGAIELIQENLTCRTGDWYDFLADAVGALVGVLIYILTKKLWKIYR